jgi:hypothetical protein
MNDFNGLECTWHLGGIIVNAFTAVGMSTCFIRKIPVACSASLERPSLLSDDLIMFYAHELINQTNHI